MFKFLILFLFTTLVFAQSEMDLIKSGKAVLIDVREKDEISQGMISDARWIPLSSMNDEQIKKLKEEFKDKKVFAYCRSGGRAGKFLKMLELSEEKSKNLGGFEELKSKGFSQKP